MVKLVMCLIEGIGLRWQIYRDDDGATELLHHGVDLVVAGAVPVDDEGVDVRSRLLELTGGRGPDKCIDAVGLEAHHGAAPVYAYDRVKQAVMLESDRPTVLREMIYVCRPAGILSIPGVYGGLIDKVPMGALMNKGLTVRTGQTHVNRWTDDLVRRIVTAYEAAAHGEAEADRNPNPRRRPPA